MAKNIQVVRTHSLPPDDARARLDALAGELEQKYGLRFSPWAGNQREGKRTGARGKVTVEATRVTVDVEVSSLIPIPESKIRASIEKRLDAALG
jgi:putative polyhydroxyalkanoate system protein